MYHEFVANPSRKLLRQHCVAIVSLICCKLGSETAASALCRYCVINMLQTRIGNCCVSIVSLLCYESVANLGRKLLRQHCVAIVSRICCKLGSETVNLRASSDNFPTTSSTAVKIVVCGDGGEGW